MTRQPKISIIIPTFYAGKLLKQCLKSIANSTYPNLETIIIDNSPQKISLKVIKKSFPPSTRFIYLKPKTNLYFANAINLGFKNSTGKYILIANDDLIFKKDSIDQLLKKLRSSSKTAAVHPKVIKRPGSQIDSLGGVMDYLGFCYKKTPTQYSSASLFYLAIGLYKRSALEKVGLYDPDFTIFWEDADLSWRLRLAGYQIKPALKAIIYHHVSASTKKLDSSFKIFHTRKNRLCGLIKNYSFSYLTIFLPLLILAYIGLSLKETYSTKNTKHLSATLKAIYWNFNHLSSTLEKRRHIQSSLRTVSDSTLNKFFMSPISF